MHIYVVNPTREVWSHSDTDGTFDVIAVADIAAGDIANLNATTVPVSLTVLDEVCCFFQGHACNLMQKYALKVSK